MKIRIHTFDQAPPMRRDNAEELGKYFDTKPYVGGRDTLTNFINICKSVGPEDLLYLEDDVQVCSEFLYHVDDAIKEYPNKVITFFYGGDFLKKKPVEKSFKEYQYSQCVFIPNNYVKQLIELEPKFRKQYYVPNDWERIFHLLDGTYIRYFPHLVQQYDWESTIFLGYTDKPSRYFVG